LTRLTCLSRDAFFLTLHDQLTADR
jgi:hypothetical protein